MKNQSTKQHHHLTIRTTVYLPPTPVHIVPTHVLVKVTSRFTCAFTLETNRSHVIYVVSRSLWAVIWSDTWSHTQGKSNTNVHNVLRLSHAIGTWNITNKHTRVVWRNNTNVSFVPPPTRSVSIWSGTCEVILERGPLNVLIVLQLSRGTGRWKFTYSLIRRRNLLRVMYATNRTQHRVIWNNTNSVTQRKNRLNVHIVLYHSLTRISWKSMSMDTRERNLLDVFSVPLPLPRVATWRHTNWLTQGRSLISVNNVASLFRGSIV